MSFAQKTFYVCPHLLHMEGELVSSVEYVLVLYCSGWSMTLNPCRPMDLAK
jgi:hypothetical protein